MAFFYTKSLTDDQVIALRNTARLDPEHAATRIAKELGAGVSTINRVLNGTMFSHLNDQCPPVVFDQVKLKPEQVADLRRRARITKLNVQQESRNLKVGPSTVRNALTGGSPVYAGDILGESPIVLTSRDFTKIFEQAKVIVRDATGTKADICRKLMAELSVSDNTAERYYDEIKGAKTRKIRTRSGNQILTDALVIRMRKLARRTGQYNFQRFQKISGASLAVLSFAMKGKTFKQVNHIAPPITERLVKKARTPSRPVVNETLIAQAMQLRRDDPLEWSYDKLAKWINDQGSTHYRRNHLIIMFRNRDPAMVELEHIEAPKPAKPPRPTRLPKTKTPRATKPKKAKDSYTNECVICEDTFETKYKDREVCLKAACRRAMEQANRYEREMVQLQS